MKRIALLLPLMALTACLEQGGSSSPAAIKAAPIDSGGNNTTPPSWQEPQTAAQAESELNGQYKLVSDNTKSITFDNSAMTSSGFIGTSHLVIIGGNPVYMPATCTYNVSNYYITSPTAQNIYQIWTAVSSYTLSAGTWSTIQDCQLPAQQAGITHTTMLVHFDSEKCITIQLMRDTTTGRQFCKD